MPTFTIRNRFTDTVLFEGQFDTMRLCVEAARKSRADLRGAYLRGANLGGADLGGADLGGANLRGAYLHGANLRGANLGGAYLGGANLHGANLHGADLRGANLGGANLRGAYLGRAYLGGAYLHGADLHGANLGGAKPRDGITINALARRATRADGHEFLLLSTSVGWRVLAGCRFFDIDEAWRHWETTRGGTDLGDESLDILTMFSLHLDRVEGSAA